MNRFDPDDHTSESIEDYRQRIKRGNEQWCSIESEIFRLQQRQKEIEDDLDRFESLLHNELELIRAEETSKQ